jgi:hypothetical protein
MCAHDSQGSRARLQYRRFIAIEKIWLRFHVQFLTSPWINRTVRTCKHATVQLSQVSSSPLRLQLGVYLLAWRILYALAQARSFSYELAPIGAALDRA